MSYVTEIFMNRQIAAAAEALDLINACQHHKLAKDSGKHKLLATIMRDTSKRFHDLASSQSAMSADEFFRKAIERVNVMRAERALIAQHRAAKRAADAAARAELQAELQMIAA